jgi:hypothetical protein
MKISPNLILVSKADGTYYYRRQRMDHIDPSKRSPAMKYAQKRFAEAAKRSKGKNGLMIIYDQAVPLGAASVATRAKGRVPARHIDGKQIKRDILQKQSSREGLTIVKAFGKIVTFFTN